MIMTNITEVECRITVKMIIIRNIKSKIILIINTVNNLYINQSQKMIIEIKIFINSKDYKVQMYYLQKQKEKCWSKQNNFKKIR